MALPTAIKEAAERADALQAKFKSGTLTVEDMGQPINAPTNPDIGTPKAGAAPAPAPAPAPPPAGEPPVVPPPETPAPPDYQHKFNVLQGKYNAEVPRLHEQNRSLSAELQSMRQQLAATQGMVAALGQQQAGNPSPAPNASGRLVKDEEIKEYGADLIDVIKRAAREAVLSEIDSMVNQRVAPVVHQVQQLTPAVQDVQQKQALTAEQQLYASLDGAVPGWEQINESQEFVNWLHQPDPYAGVPRGAMLAQAFQNGDVPRVAQFFTGFQKENAVVSPSGTTPPAAQAAIPAVSLAALAAPGTGNGGPPAGAPNEAGRRIYTVAEISEFYRDVQKGAYRGKVAQAQAIEKDIFLAQKQGRVRAR